MKNNSKEFTGEHPLASYNKEDLFILDGRKILIITLGDVIPDEDIEMFSADLEEHGIKVNVQDVNGKLTASETELTSVISFILQTPILAPLIAATGHSATWDVIKFFVKSSWNKVKGQKYTRHYSNKEEQKDITMGVRAQINNNTYEFNLKGIQDENVDIAIDKILDFFREQTPNQQWQTFIATFDNTEQEWQSIELREVIKKNKIKE